MADANTLSDRNLYRLLGLNALALPIGGVAAVLALPAVATPAAFTVGALTAGLLVWTGVAAVGIHGLIMGSPEDDLPVLEEAVPVPAEQESQMAA